mmetsp:Transcript_80628/g.127259  ORF Transcript_80628/g.127259 Transcript_80628/m.127259 type:complete len:86 (+) Transcript_80628:94-351(+)
MWRIMFISFTCLALLCDSVRRDVSQVLQEDAVLRESNEVASAKSFYVKPPMEHYPKSDPISRSHEIHSRAARVLQDKSMRDDHDN